MSETITETDYADVLALPANTPAQAKFILYSLELAARGIGLYDTSLYMKSEISRPVHIFIGSGVNICIGKASTTIDRVSIT